MQAPCDVCGGRGQMASHKCPHCSGNKVVRTDKTLDLMIERGMPDGHEVVFEKEGEQSPGIIPGDVVIKLKTKPHPRFVRRGNDLLHDMTITLKEALVGFRKTVTHLDGHSVLVSSNQVIQHGEVMGIQGEGMPKFEEASDRGNLEIKFSIKMPASLSEAQKTKVREILGVPA
jgi:DnaJ-related protein SCJ1